MHRSYEITPRDPALGGGWNLALFDQGERAGGGVYPVAQEEPAAGMTWWNSMTEKDRAHWMTMAASAVPADARHAFLLAEAYEDAQAQGEDWVGVDG